MAVCAAYPSEPFQPVFHPPIKLPSLRPGGHGHVDRWIDCTAVRFTVLARIEIHTCIARSGTPALRMYRRSRAVAVCNVTPPVVRRWRSLGLISTPPWTLEQLPQIRDQTDPAGRRRGPQTAHGTLIRWTEGCDCDQCRRAQNDAARARGRARARARLP